MVSTSGHKLLEDDAIQSLKDELSLALEWQVLVAGETNRTSCQLSPKVSTRHSHNTQLARGSWFVGNIANQS